MKYLFIMLAVIGILLVFSSPTFNKGKVEPDPVVIEPTQPYVLSQTGVASYYDYTLDSGWSSLGHNVCATRDWERYSYVRVTNIANGKSIVCKITDYGPEEAIFPERIVDLSSHAFSQIADLKLGVINVTITYEERS